MLVELGLVELGLVEQRYRAVLEVLNDGASVVDVARRYGVARQTVHMWLRAYAARGLGGLADRSSRPLSCPHQMHRRSRPGSCSCAGTILAGAPDVVMRRLRFVVDELPVQLVRVYHEPGLVAGSKLEQPVMIPDGVHAELRRLGVRVTRFVEDFMGARLPNPEEERALQLPSGVPVTRNIRTAYAGDQPVEVMDTISHGEVVMHRFEIKL
jgi:hypothetical protein